MYPGGKKYGGDRSPPYAVYKVCSDLRNIHYPGDIVLGALKGQPNLPSAEFRRDYGFIERERGSVLVQESGGKKPVVTVESADDLDILPQEFLVVRLREYFLRQPVYLHESRAAVVGAAVVAHVVRGGSHAYHGEVMPVVQLVQHELPGLELRQVREIALRTPGNRRAFLGESALGVRPAPQPGVLYLGFRAEYPCSELLLPEADQPLHRVKPPVGIPDDQFAHSVLAEKRASCRQGEHIQHACLVVPYRAVQYCDLFHIYTPILIF